MREIQMQNEKISAKENEREMGLDDIAGIDRVRRETNVFELQLDTLDTIPDIIFGNIDQINQ